MDVPCFVLVGGPPGSGKTTLAPPLAAALGLPLVAKDVIKDALMSVLGCPDVETSRRLGGAAVAAMFATAACSPVGAVIESCFHRDRARSEVEALAGRIVEVFCRCDRATCLDRHRARAGTRAAGHFDHLRTPDELWNDEVAQPIGGPWPLLEVDTSTPVDTDELAARIAALAATDEQARREPR